MKANNCSHKLLQQTVPHWLDYTLHHTKLKWLTSLGRLYYRITIKSVISFVHISQILLDFSPQRVGWALTFCCHYSVKAIKFPLSALGDSLYVPIGFYFNLCCFPHLDSFKGQGVGEIHRSQLERGINWQQENELTRLLLWIFSS